MGALDRAFEAAAAAPPRVVMPETEDPRIVEAAVRLVAEGLAEVVELCEPDEALAAVLVETRGVKPALAARMVGKPLILVVDR